MSNNDPIHTLSVVISLKFIPNGRGRVRPAEGGKGVDLFHNFCLMVPLPPLLPPQYVGTEAHKHNRLNTERNTEKGCVVDIGLIQISLENPRKSECWVVGGGRVRGCD
jgi:hypothetical protein